MIERGVLIYSARDGSPGVAGPAAAPVPHRPIARPKRPPSTVASCCQGNRARPHQRTAITANNRVSKSAHRSSIPRTGRLSSYPLSAWCLFDLCRVTPYNPRVIRSFRHKGLKALYEGKRSAKVVRSHVSKLERILSTLDEATGHHEMDLPSFRVHPLKGKSKGYFSVWVSGNWRVTFRFDGIDAVDVDYLDYH